MSKHFRILFAAAFIVGILAMSVGPVAQAQDKVTITWFVGLGTGTNLEPDGKTRLWRPSMRATMTEL
jgi:hypothetical protein